MKLDHLQSLTEDELAMLWFCINKINPPLLSTEELEPRLFVSIKHKRLMDRLLLCTQHVKEEHQSVFAGLVNKLSVY
jgi:hypothetical protein